jgi:hypothetical protein
VPYKERRQKLRTSPANQPKRQVMHANELGQPVPPIEVITTTIIFLAKKGRNHPHRVAIDANGLFVMPYPVGDQPPLPPEEDTDEFEHWQLVKGASPGSEQAKLNLKNLKKQRMQRR